MSFFLLLNTKEDILRLLVNKQLMVAIDYCMEKKYHGRQWLPSTVFLPTVLKISSFVFNRRKKLSIYLLFYRSICRSIYLLFYLLFYHSKVLQFNLSIYPSIHLSIYILFDRLF